MKSSALGPAKKRLFSLPQRLLPPLKVSSTRGAEPVVFFTASEFFFPVMAPAAAPIKN